LNDMRINEARGVMIIQEIGYRVTYTGNGNSGDRIPGNLYRSAKGIPVT
jgi:hypothetical protein